MSFTLWSRGQLVGHSDLSARNREARTRAGPLHLTTFGESVIEIACGVARATIESDLSVTAMADIAAAVDRVRALELQLRGPDGAVIPTNDIIIHDTQLVLQLAEIDLTTDAIEEAEVADLFEKGGALDASGPFESADAFDAAESHEAWYEQLSEAERAAFDESVEHDRALIDEWLERAESDPGSSGEGIGTNEMRWGDLPRYELHVQLPADHPM